MFCALLSATGCKQILGLDPGVVALEDATPVDAPEEDAAPDAVIDAGPEWTIELVPTGVDNDQDPTLTPDLLEMYFTRNNRIYFMTRPSVVEPWSAPQPASFAAPGGGDVDASAEISADGLAIVFGSTRGNGSGLDVYYVLRSTRTSAWSSPQSIPALNVTGPINDAPGGFTQDYLRVVLSSAREGDEDLFEAVRPTLNDVFGAPTKLTFSSPTEIEAAPHISLDGKRLYFSKGPTAARDIYMTARATVNSAWLTPVRVSDGISTASNESDPWASADNNQLYFSSDRGGTTRIYHAYR